MEPERSEFATELATFGFVDQGSSRRGGRQWSLAFNRYLTFDVHDFGDELVFTWVCDLGEFALERGMQVGAGETSFQELYPQHDVRLPLDIDAVRAEISFTLSRLRFDLGDPNL